jgi:tRNA dimethylallyltransferase
MRAEQFRSRAVLIAGPTASGKSALASEIARRFGGLVINADSMQVYRDLRILTARPSESEESALPHRLFGHIDGAKAYSVMAWLKEAEATLRQAEEADRLPVFVGGTGLYFKALTQGLSAIPDVPEAIRDEWRDWARDRPASSIHAELARRDPIAAARLRPSDPQRTLRALEVFAATGESIVAFQERRQAPLLLPDEVTAFALQIDRPQLRARIDYRFDRMLDEGAVAEVARLAARHLDPTRPIMRAIGVAPLLRHVKGEIGRDEAAQAGKAASRLYAKRQETFLRTQLPYFRPSTAEQALADLGALAQSPA